MSIKVFHRDASKASRSRPRSLKLRFDALESRELKTADIPSDATLIRNPSTSEIDVWETDGRHYVSAAIENAMGDPAPLNLNPTQFATIPKSHGPDFVPVGMYVRNPATRKIALWESDQEAHYVSPSVYAALGRPPVVNLTASQLRSLPKGAPL